MEKRHYIERNHNFCTLIAKHLYPVDVLTNPYAISWKKKTFVQPPDYQNEIQDYLDSYDYQNKCLDDNNLGNISTYLWLVHRKNES